MTQTGHSSEDMDSEATRFYRHLKQIWSGKKHSSRPRDKSEKRGGSLPFDAGRDPHSIGSTIGSLSRQLGWVSELAQSQVLIGWSSIAGENMAEHSHPVDLKDGVLVIQCDSTAWATELRLMRSTILQQIALRYPEAKVETIRFLGPDVPSWKHGFRSVPGRGPRDTYG
ncbi:DciA family protein [Lysinibacter sp. HNR]|uniref:DUF721 domain-containing protein n=1 Tax=Lysinibacter sp. HNR TaxID=3031408 RepID=UPI002434C930|nr:DciA family protein [Lysinibacter sp. HNR]WGD37347.1 DciA family protein [Lysinibacter sp. HNR]